MIRDLWETFFPPSPIVIAQRGIVEAEKKILVDTDRMEHHKALVTCHTNTRARLQAFVKKLQDEEEKEYQRKRAQTAKRDSERFPPRPKE
jgi:hypothetical protein